MAAMPSTPHPMAAAFEKAVADKMNMRGGSKQSGAATYPKLGHKNAGAGGVGGGKTPPGWTRGNKTGWGGKAMPPGQYQVEGGRSVSAPINSQKAALARGARETQVYNQGGFGKGKAPEVTYRPPGSKAVARFKSGKPVPRSL